VNDPDDVIVVDGGVVIVVAGDSSICLDKMIL
jgi:hypothetical protein